MNKYAASPTGDNAELHDKTSTKSLEFPVDPGFLSLPPQLDPQLMLERIAQSLSWRNGRPGETERRLAMKVDVEFVLRAG
ncbi:MAG TPA: hypothetical protein VJA21_20670 [Verrucomicrobiae bacterium]